jgi:hypothetical protein
VATHSGEIRMKKKHNFQIGDLFVAKNPEKVDYYYPAIGYIIGIEIHLSFEDIEAGVEIRIKWFGKDNPGYYLPSQLINYIHYPVE